MKHRCRLYAACVLAALALCLLPVNPAAAAQPKALRVGFPQQDGLSETSDTGARSGYTYEYLQELAQYTGWNYEFVTPEADDLDGQLTVLLQMLEDGEIDLLGGMNYHPSLAARYAYPNYNYGTSYTVLRVRADNTAINEGNYQTLDHIRVGYLAPATSRLQALEAFCESNHLSMQAVAFYDERGWEGALRTKTVDALLGSDTDPRENTRVVAKFDPHPFYLATSKDNTALIRQINAAITQVNSVDPSFAATLYEKYFGNQPAGLMLSDEEKSYIAGLSAPLRVGVRPGRIPYQYFDGHGQFQGIAQGVFSYITQETGLEFTFVPIQDGAQPDMPDGAQPDLLASVYYDYETAAADGVSLTRPYVVCPMVMVVDPRADTGDMSGKRLALPQGLLYKDGLTEDITVYPTFQDCLEAVRKGKADYCYGNAYAAQYYISQPRYRNLRLLPQANRMHKVCIGVVKPADSRLISILNKVVLSMPDAELQSIIYRNVTVRPQVTLRALIEANPVPAFCLVLAAALLVVSVMALFVRQRTRANRRLALESERFRQLADLSGEYLFEYDFAADRLTLSERSAEHFGVPPVFERYAVTLQRCAQLDSALAPQAQFIEGLLRSHAIVQDLPCTFTDGKRRWLRVAAKVIADKDGRPLFSIGKVADIQAEREEHEALVHKAQRDSLTGVYNAATARTLVSERLRSLRPGSRGALLVLDIDHFKEVNDQYGHYIGDQVLIQAAATLQSVFRRDDIIGRLGGDEFLVFLPGGASRDILEAKCRQLQGAMRDNIHMAGGLAVTVSVGAVFAEAGSAFDPLYRAADAALYEVKRNGRNNFDISDGVTTDPGEGGENDRTSEPKQ
ncbi:diguanylate cyclase [Intestinibacillus massiliensis]|nr:diguanylate cyclase [Intestinibacillus massiliensis]